MAKTDFQYCKGQNCQYKGICKRYVEGLEAAKETDKTHSWINSCRNAKLFIRIDND